jgi:hypothetical protein
MNDRSITERTAILLNRYAELAMGTSGTEADKDLAAEEMADLLQEWWDNHKAPGGCRTTRAIIAGDFTGGNFTDMIEREKYGSDPLVPEPGPNG